MLTRLWNKTKQVGCRIRAWAQAHKALLIGLGLVVVIVLGVAVIYTLAPAEETAVVVGISLSEIGVKRVVKKKIHHSAKKMGPEPHLFSF